jgi:serine phosphatase RsbU (regulator of sigma subunit)
LGRNYEPIGLVVLFGCLGYLVANRFFQNEKELITLAHELETARQIQSFILPQEMEKIPPWEQFKTFISSNSQLSGNDFADRLIKAVSDWSGKGAKDNLDDDLTLIVIDCENLGNDIT